MCVDHAGLALFPNVGAFRCVGRIAFPLYCFLLTQGFLHTRSLRAYARRLLLLALISEIPNDLLLFGRVSSSAEQNALFALLFGLAALIAAHAYRKKNHVAFAAILSLCIGTMAARVSYGWLGVALCLCTYYADGRKLRLALSFGAAQLAYALSLLLSGVALSWVLVSLCAPAALIPILLYNGKRGPHSPALSFLFYAAFPLHLLALIAIRALRIIPPYFIP